MNNEEQKNEEVVNELPKPVYEYELLKDNEVGLLKTFRRKSVQYEVFNLGEIADIIRQIREEKKKSHAQVELYDSIISNIKSNHPEILEYYENLEPLKQTAILLLCKTIADREKWVKTVQAYFQQEKILQEEYDEVRKQFNLN